jgi:hypothetical protein
MDTITTIGLDIAKSVFRVHGIDAAGNPVVRRQLKRRHVIFFFSESLSRVSSVSGLARRRTIILKLVTTPSPIASIEWK